MFGNSCSFCIRHFFHEGLEGLFLFQSVQERLFSTVIHSTVWSLVFFRYFPSEKLCWCATKTRVLSLVVSYSVFNYERRREKYSVSQAMMWRAVSRGKTIHELRLYRGGDCLEMSIPSSALAEQSAKSCQERDRWARGKACLPAAVSTMAHHFDGTSDRNLRKSLIRKARFFFRDNSNRSPIG